MKFNLFFLIPLVWSYSTWTILKNKSIQISTNLRQARIISPTLDIKCRLLWNSRTNFSCYNVNIESMKTFFPNPLIMMLVSRAKEKNLTVDIIEFNGTYVKMLWTLDNYSDSLELIKSN